MIRDMITVGDVEAAGRMAAERLIADRVCESATHHARTESTNSLALSDLRSGEMTSQQLPRLYLADDQTAGRGRHGRTWASNQGTLTFSLLIDWPLVDDCPTRLLSLGVGVGIARAIEHLFAPLRTQLKWPNDVHIDFGKVAGVLIERSHSNRQRAVIGVGMNVSRAPELKTADSSSTRIVPPRSIAEVAGRPIDRYGMLESSVSQILESIEGLRKSDEEILGEYRSRCVLTGRRVTFRDGDEVVEGDCVGVTNQGELAIDTAQGRQHLRSGEASLVRIRP
jgi:BirA family biotin operon repressor/biotin-[acetyl-CoA-carboxylase] ligase